MENETVALEVRLIGSTHIAVASLLDIPLLHADSSLWSCYVQLLSMLAHKVDVLELSFTI